MQKELYKRSRAYAKVVDKWPESLGIRYGPAAEGVQLQSVRQNVAIKTKGASSQLRTIAEIRHQHAWMDIHI